MKVHDTKSIHDWTREEFSALSPEKQFEKLPIVDGFRIFHPSKEETIEHAFFNVVVGFHGVDVDEIDFDRSYFKVNEDRSVHRAVIVFQAVELKNAHMVF